MLLKVVHVVVGAAAGDAAVTATTAGGVALIVAVGGADKLAKNSFLGEDGVPLIADEGDV